MRIECFLPIVAVTVTSNVSDVDSDLALQQDVVIASDVSEMIINSRNDYSRRCPVGPWIFSFRSAKGIDSWCAIENVRSFATDATCEEEDDTTLREKTGNWTSTPGRRNYQPPAVERRNLPDDRVGKNSSDRLPLVSAATAMNFLVKG
ncbi:unnamed protein product [Soboliphyme baturini]|uniref:Secreted protein n=1 Tax=Soboliphyme baturini TaxID=241478 RepID=A0A183J4E7_9BILA|nr:unnamed protein product [Soboliphyme baturini]